MKYNHDYDKILTRLTVILSKLNDGEALSAKELAAEFNVSERTIQRDFKERLISFPIYKDGKRWKMQDGFKIEKTNSFEDAIVLDILEGFVSSNKGVFAKRAKKLLSKLKNDDINPFYTKLDMEDISDKLSDISLLEKAIKEKRVIKCSYFIEDFSYDTTLKPLKIANYYGTWYLIALREDMVKKYYLKNIYNISLTDEKFQTSIQIETILENSLSVWFDKSSDPFEVKLYATKDVVKYFERKPLPTQKLIEYDEGGMEFVVTITHEMEIIPIIKQWLPNLIVLEPQWLDEMIIEDIENYITRKN